MKKNLEDFLRRDIDILLENRNLTSHISQMIIDYIEGDYYLDTAVKFLKQAAWEAQKIVQDNEDAGL